jgi:hypothetical protein
MTEKWKLEQWVDVEADISAPGGGGSPGSAGGECHLTVRWAPHDDGADALRAMMMRGGGGAGAGDDGGVAVTPGTVAPPQPQPQPWLHCGQDVAYWQQQARDRAQRSLWSEAALAYEIVCALQPGTAEAEGALRAAAAQLEAEEAEAGVGAGGCAWQPLLGPAMAGPRSAAAAPPPDTTTTTTTAASLPSTPGHAKGTAAPAQLHRRPTAAPSDAIAAVQAEAEAEAEHARPQGRQQRRRCRWPCMCMAAGRESPGRGHALCGLCGLWGLCGLCGACLAGGGAGPGLLRRRHAVACELARYARAVMTVRQLGLGSPSEPGGLGSMTLVRGGARIWTGTRSEWRPDQHSRRRRCGRWCGRRCCCCCHHHHARGLLRGYLLLVGPALTAAVALGPSWVALAVLALWLGAPLLLGCALAPAHCRRRRRLRQRRRPRAVVPVAAAAGEGVQPQ